MHSLTADWRLCSFLFPLRSAQRQEATRTRTPGWLARLIRVHHLAGKRLGSEVPADPLISIGGCSHYQREVLQLPLQHGDRAARPLDTAHGVAGCLGRRPETASHQEQLKYFGSLARVDQNIVNQIVP